MIDRPQHGSRRVVEVRTEAQDDCPGTGPAALAGTRTSAAQEWSAGPPPRRETASLELAAPRGAAEDVLLDAVNLPVWNPAFVSVLPRHWVAGQDTYAIRTTGGMRGTLSYDTAGAPDVVRITWRVPGLAETGAWLLSPHGRPTLVTHEFVRCGALARVLAPAARGVAALRLARLEDRLENLAHWSGRWRA